MKKLLLGLFIIRSVSSFAGIIAFENEKSRVSLYCPDKGLLEYLKDGGNAISISLGIAGSLEIAYEPKTYRGKRFYPIKVVQASAGCSYESFDKVNPSKKMRLGIR